MLKKIGQKIQKVLNKQSSVFDEIERDVDDIRARLKSLQNEKAKLLKAPAAEKEVTKRIEQVILRLADGARNLWPEMLVTADFDAARTLECFVKPREISPVTNNFVVIHNLQPSPAETLALFVPDLLRAGMMKEARLAAEQTGDAIEDGERQSRLAAIDDEVFENQCAEELLIRSAGDAGFTIDRRADVDVALVLAADHELQ
jgi:hypothetical protein